MNRLIAAEIRKLRATPTMWWLFAGAILLGIGGTVAALAFASASDLALDSDEAIQGALHSSGAGSMLVVVAGIISMAGEFRHGQADQTFLTDPRRAPTIVAKVAVMAVTGALFGLTATFASLGTTWTWLRAEDVAFPGGSVVWLTVLGAVVSATLYGVLGIALGAASRNQVAAIVATLAWLTVAETVINTGSSSIGRWLPGVAALALRRDPGEGLLPMALGGIVLAAWVMAALVGGLFRTRHADVTG